MKRKQILSTVLATAMSLTLLVGCGGKVEESKEQESGSQVASDQVQESNAKTEEEDPYKDVRITDDIVTLTVAGPSGAVAQDWTNTLQYAEYEKRLGIKLDATTYSNEQWSSKFTLMMASDEMPDLLAFGYQKPDRSEVQQYVEEGYFLDFSKYLDIMPNVSRLMEENPGWAKAITSDDGGIYAFTTLSLDGISTAAQYIFLSEAWLKNVGLERPETLEEFYNVLKAFKEQDANGNGDPNDEIPMAFSATGKRHCTVPIRCAFGIDNTASWDTDLLWKVENGKVGIWNNTDNFKEYLKFMHKLYAEELLDNNSYVMSNEELEALAKEGRVGYVSNLPSVGVEKELQDKMQWYQVVGLKQDGYQDKNIWANINTYSTGVVLAANADTKYPEVVAKFVDYLCSEEGSLSSRNGYEGVTFDWIEVDGYKIADHEKKAEEAGLSAGDYRNKVLAVESMTIVSYPEGTIYDMLNNVDIGELTNTDGECWKATTVNALRAEGMRRPTTVIVDPYPVLFYTDEEKSDRAVVVTDINNYLVNMVAQFITGETDIDAGWDAYVKKLDEMGLDRLIDIEQAAYNRYINN